MLVLIDEAARASIDAEIDASLGRIQARCAPYGHGASLLAEAIARSTAGGKRFRPALVFAAFEAFGGTDAAGKGVFTVAAAFELLHTAFVVHDDVIDHDTLRRGILNVSGEFRLRGRARGADAAGAAVLGDAAGILAGDLVLHEAERLLALAPLPRDLRAMLLDVVDEAVIASVAGELADVEHSVATDWNDASAILDATLNKTAVYSFSAPLYAGALLAGAGDPDGALRRSGEQLGLAFQLVDDLIGAFGSAAAAGREEGVDLRESKRTPLVAMARESDDWPRVSDALSLAHTGPVAVRTAQRLLEESGARRRLLGMIEDTLDRARTEAQAATLPPAARDLVQTLTMSMQERMT